jgi:hypothetical protein
MGNLHDAVFSFLDDRHFVVPAIPTERPDEIVLNVHRLCHHQSTPPHQAPTLVHSHALSLADVLTDVCSLRFFPDVSARGGASPGHFYADASARAFGMQIEATSLATKRETVQEVLVPVRALVAPVAAPPRPSPPPPYRRASVCYEPFLGRRLAYASRVAGREVPVPAEKLPPALRGVRSRQLRFVICCGALLVFEVCVSGTRTLCDGVERS